MSTIHFYIILKLEAVIYALKSCLSTIHFYIILKLGLYLCMKNDGLSTIHFYIILKPLRVLRPQRVQFEYHTFLHHSQTSICDHDCVWTFEYHTFLHHSQTGVFRTGCCRAFEYHTFLHHSQTMTFIPGKGKEFEYHTFLHHSQTSNSKIICHHLHIQNKVLKPPLINFTSIFIYNISHSPFYTSLFLIFNK